MELGQYGWNRQVKMFQQHTVFLERPAVETQNYGVLNMGDAPFDGVSPGCFKAFGSAVGIAINVSTIGNYAPFMYQVAGSSKFSIYGDSSTFIKADAYSTVNQGLLNLGAQFYSGAGQFAGSANGTYLAINSLSGFTGRYIDCQKAGSTLLFLDNNGNLLLYAGFLQISHDPDPSNLYGLVNIGNQYFTGVGQFSGSGSGTGISVNLTSGFIGNLADWQINGVSKFSVSAIGDVRATTLTTTKLTGLAAVEAALEFT